MPRSLSRGSNTIIFLPFHGTFFFRRGGAGAGDGVDATFGIVWAAKADALHSCFGGGGGGLSSNGEDEASFSPAEAALPIVSDMLGRTGSEKSSCFNVSVLCFLSDLLFELRAFSLDSRNRLRVGVRGSASCLLSPEMDPLSEECSLSPGSSLSQWFASPDSPPVCWRIQSSVKP